MRKKKVVKVFLFTLLAFGFSYLINVQFNKMNTHQAMIASLKFGIETMFICTVFYSYIFEPRQGQNGEFWKKIRESIGKNSENV